MKLSMTPEMKYVLRIGALGDSPEIEISEKEYTTVKQSRTTLINCLAIEEKYEILISNYIDFEKQILDTIATYMIREHIDYSDFFDVRLGLDIRLVNLLTSGRLYIDQLPQHVRECVPHVRDSDTLVKAMLAKEYDENPEYRFMEALRNYVQHCGLPVHWTSSQGRWTDVLSEDGLLEYSMELASQKTFLLEDGMFKKSVLDEISDNVDLKTTTRSYIESLSTVHDAVRKLIQESVQNSRRVLEDAHSQYVKVYEKSLVGLSACMTENREPVETIPLLLDWDNIRVKLQTRNQRLSNLKRRYATGKARKL